MKIKLLFLVLTVLMVIMFNLTTNYAFPIIPPKLPEFGILNEFFDRAIKSDRTDRKIWTKTKLHDRLPRYIKSVLIKNGLIPWQYLDCKYDENRDNYVKTDIYLPILVTYIKSNNFIFKTSIIEYKINGFMFRTGNLVLNIDITDLDYRKQAEAYFNSLTGRLIKLKIKKENRWITIYDLKNKIGIKIKI